MSSTHMIVQDVDSLQFSIMGPEEICSRSVVEVTKNETYEKDVPVVKGLFDLRMGTTELGKTCMTCGQGNKHCPGHFGHITLAKPIYHYHFIDIIMKLLKCICFRCGHLLVDPEHPRVKQIAKKSSKVRFKEILEMSGKVSRCGQETPDGCGCQQPDRYKINGISGIEAMWKSLGEGGSHTQKLQAEYVKMVFEKISVEDYTLLGFNESWCKPEWLICTVLPVPPPSVRPSVKKQGDSQRMEDDLTHKLVDIIKFNNGLNQKIDTNCRKELIDDWTEMIQYHVATMIDNEISGVSQSSYKCSGRPIKAIRQRLKGKEGRIRSNLMGKRVDYSARSVITPDPNIELDELGVPIRIAMNLTFPDIVNHYNMETLLRYVRNGPHVWPGAKNVVKGTVKLSLTPTNKEDMKLEIGDVVNRHLIDGDYVLFNRQPSLHKMSMMGHRVRVMTGNTFRLNVSVTPPYNADFDGDEMNLHAPQSIQSVSELINIASVDLQIISPRENKPIITIVQDTLLGVYKLTNSDVIQYPEGSKLHYSSNTNIYEIPEGTNGTTCVPSCIFTKSQMMNLVSDLSTFHGIPPPSDLTHTIRGEPIEMWTGHAILSFILPETVNLEMPNGRYDDIKDSSPESDGVKKVLKSNNSAINLVKIVKGMITQGTFDKSLFSKTSKGLIHTINNDLGPMRAHQLIDDLQKIVSYFLLIEGFSVGISDMLADKETGEKIQKIIDERKQEIESIMQEVHLDIFEDVPGKSKHTFFEGKVNAKLNKTIKDTGKVGLDNLDPKNRTTYMVNSGSKGKMINVSQMVACLGQQNVDGQRIKYGFEGRTLPHYQKYDDSPGARGFVENSFISGQTPQEFYFHAMAGREGLIDTAVKTSSTGYVQRQLVKAMEDLVVTYDYSVRSSSGTIVQFVYGNDGMDATFVESQPLLLTKHDTETLVEKYYISESTEWNKLVSKDIAKSLQGPKHTQAFEDSFKQLLNHRDYLYQCVFHGNPENNINYPIHINRIVENVCLKSHMKQKPLSDISPLDILSKNKSLVEKTYVRKEFPNNRIFEILVDVHLHPKTLIHTYRISSEEYDTIISILLKKFNDCKISPGEMVGALAAQSIGEPATQMTLNTFHFAGVSAKSNVTRGIPRLKELIHVSKNMKSPSTIVYLRDDMCDDQLKARFAKHQMEYTVLKDVISSSAIYYDPKHVEDDTDISEDKQLLAFYRFFEQAKKGISGEVEEEQESQETMVPWIIRFTFNKELMVDKGITMEDIALVLHKYDSETLSFVYTDDNAKELVGRISLDIKPPSEYEEGVQDQSDIISIFKNINNDIMNNVVIKGIQNIKDIVISDSHRTLKQDKEYKRVKEHILETDGTNLLEALMSEYTDETRCYSNDIVEVYNVLGIEAARNILIEEIQGVVAHEDEYINQRHIEVLCDTMTSRGILMPINRQGINLGDIGPLAKCSFEDTTDQLIKASIFSEKDKLTGVSSNIMLGQMIRSGTGMSQLLLDEEEFTTLLQESKSEADEFQQINEQNIDMYLTTEEDEDYECALDDFRFSFE